MSYYPNLIGEKQADRDINERFLEGMSGNLNGRSK